MTRLATRAQRDTWIALAACCGALVVMSVPTTVVAQSPPDVLAGDRTLEGVTVAALGLVLWGAAEALRRQRRRERTEAGAERSTTPPVLHRPSGDRRSRAA